MKSPIITRKHASRLTAAAVADREKGHKAHIQALLDAAQIGREKQRDEWEQIALPVMRRMVDVTATRRPEVGDFVLHFNLDRRMLEQAAMTNDGTVWRYLAEMIGRHIERELGTMNFAGLNRMADDYDRRYRRVSYELPSTTVRDAF